MGKLYDTLVASNPSLKSDSKGKHKLNIFFTRLLFCFFAEDANIFEKDLFTQSIISNTLDDGSDLDIFLSKLFNVLSSKNSENIQEYLTRFPYVNGGLFDKDFYIPKFNKEARSILIEGGSLNWAEINPDILGSMMQAIVSEGVRHEIGMHYTSSSNILKTIKPLFLDDLYKKLLDADKNLKKLKNLLLRIYNISIFDPACGSEIF